jgi:hypothetical protein
VTVIYPLTGDIGEASLIIKGNIKGDIKGDIKGNNLSTINQNSWSASRCNRLKVKNLGSANNQMPSETNSDFGC